MEKTKLVEVKLQNYVIANNKPFTLIAGPCAIESLEHSSMMAEELLNICNKLNINLIYKSSFDKANRTSNSSFRGVGVEKGLAILETIKNKFKIPVVTDVHEASQCAEVASVVDVLQIPAFLCRQTDLVLAAANTGKVVNIKKGQFLAPWDMQNIVDKFISTGNNKLLICERGVSFGYNNLVVDMTSLPIMAQTGFPVIFDGTHSVQKPGGLGKTTGGRREMIPYLTKAAIAVGVAGLFLEVHQDPDNAPSDGPNMLKLNELENLLVKLQKFDQLAKN
ncbi:3-deoxy-8-phosphooctulonate synthase [Rickettsiales bacterium LUAb2]